MSEFKTTPTLIQHLSNVANSTAHNESNSKFSLPTQSKKKRFYVLNCLFRFILALPFRPELCTNTMSLSVSHVVISTIPRCHIFIRRFQRNTISHQMTPTIIINVWCIIICEEHETKPTLHNTTKVFCLGLKQIILQHNIQDPHDEDYIMAHLISSHLSSLAY